MDELIRIPTRAELEAAPTEQYYALMSRMTEALTIASTIDQIKTIRDAAQIAIYCAKQRDLGREAQNAGAELKLRAERALGAALKNTPKNEGVKGQLAGKDSSGGFIAQPPEENKPKLADLGIDKTLSHRAQKVASLPEEQFETYIEKAKESKEEITTAGVLALAKKNELSEIKESHERLKKVGDPSMACVVTQDALSFLLSLEEASAHLLLTDPPYMTHVEDIHTFAHQWLPVALSRVRSDGRAYVCIGPYPDELLAYLTAPRAGFELPQILVWTYRNTMGPSPELDYKFNWQAILYFRGADAAPLNCELLNEQFTVQDISAPDGRQGTRYHEWQKPDELAERFIRHSTRLDNLVIDPFAGTGTFIAAAARLGRGGIGAEIDAAQIAICEKRGIKVVSRK